jgi:hypothetical protein
MGPAAAAMAASAPAAQGHATRCQQCGRDIGREWHYGFESIDLAPAVGAQCPRCGAITCAADLAYGPDGNYPACPRCGVAPETLSGGAAYSSMVEQAEAARRYRGALTPPAVLGRPVTRG